VDGGCDLVLFVLWFLCGLEIRDLDLKEGF
jgi:hypothetical protein